MNVGTVPQPHTIRGSCMDCGATLPQQYGPGRPYVRCSDCAWKHKQITDRQVQQNRDPAARAEYMRQHRIQRKAKPGLRTVCLDCHQLALPGDPRCADHKRQQNTTESKARRGAGRDPLGGNWAWRVFRDRLVAEHPWCDGCGTTGTRSNPLTGDHITPLYRGGALLDEENIQVLCRVCNSRKWKWKG